MVALIERQGPSFVFVATWRVELVTEARFDNDPSRNPSPCRAAIRGGGHIRWWHRTPEARQGIDARLSELRAAGYADVAVA